MSVHLSRRLNGLSQPEVALVRAIAELDGSRAGDVFEAFEEETGLQYTRFSELVNKLDRSGPSMRHMATRTSKVVPRNS
jgi:cell division control protein 6